MTKGATIKLRLSESEKAAWEAQAAADGITLSALVRQRMNNPVVRADGVLDRDEARAEAQRLVEIVAEAGPPRQGCPANGKPCHCTGACRSVGTPFSGTSANWVAPAPLLPKPLIYFEPTIGTADYVSPRRDATCQHARPPYAYCPSCDA